MLSSAAEACCSRAHTLAESLIFVNVAALVKVLVYDMATSGARLTRLGEFDGQDARKGAKAPLFIPGQH